MKNLSNGREALRDDPNNGSLGEKRYVTTLITAAEETITPISLISLICTPLSSVTIIIIH